MQASQGLNGIHGLPATTERTLSEVDQVAVRELYGPCETPGSVKGRVHNSRQGNLIATANAHVWIEDLSSGRVIGSTFTNNRGDFSMSCVPVGDYRAMIEYSDLALVENGRGRASGKQRQFRSAEIDASFRVTAGMTSTVNYVLVPPYSNARLLQPRFFGAAGELSTVPLVAEAGSRLTVYIEGPGVDQVPGNGFIVSSPLITVDPESLTLQQPRNAAPVVSFDVILDANAAPGDYTIRLQSNSGELAYLVGAITIEPDVKQVLDAQN
jgi:hypothetical protein